MPSIFMDSLRSVFVYLLLFKHIDVLDQAELTEQLS